jgi:hypothetical protein
MILCGNYCRVNHSVDRPGILEYIISEGGERKPAVARIEIVVVSLNGTSSMNTYKEEACQVEF